MYDRDNLIHTRWMMRWGDEGMDTYCPETVALGVDILKTLAVMVFAMWVLSL